MTNKKPRCWPGPPSRLKIHRGFIVLILLLVFQSLICFSVAADSSPAPLRIGVLANKGIEDCKASWQPTIDYLDATLPGYRFELVPLTFANITRAIADHDVDFVLSNPGISADLEVNYGVSNILTLNNYDEGHFIKEFGGVLFTRRDREDIRTYHDLAGKRIVAAGNNSFGGWYSVLRELKDQGIDPDRDFASLRFSESHTGVVTSILKEEADAGIVRTGTLEQMQDEGKIHIADFSVFPPPEHYRDPAFPYLYSTRLYPEWTLAKLPQTDDAAASSVAIALLKVTPDLPAARAAKMGRWTIPVNYQSVHDCLMEIRAPPYENYGVITPADLLREYLFWILAIVLLITSLTLITVRYVRANRQLNILRQNLETDILERKRAEGALKEANRKLNLLSGITRHDIKNQLLALKGYLELSKGSLGDAEKTSAYIRKEERAAHAIERQILFTKEYENLGAGASVWQSVEKSLHTTLTSLPLGSIRVAGEVRDLEVYADPLFERVFYNLIDNALRYGGENMTSIHISPQESENGLVIVVEDDGEGISEEDKVRLFERGFGKNTGLGLFLSREILAITGIRITETGTAGKGARFEILVPKGGYRYTIQHREKPGTGSNNNG
jgi:signal transduction histidine kinase/ABC-type phosphate/phosphonate transport system substrate-binding protein